MSTLNVFTQSVKQQFVSLVLLNFTQKYYQDIQLKLLQQDIQFHPDHLKSVREN